jgi:hypothetical protein
MAKRGRRQPPADNRSRHRDPIADYVEWTENRYNPGYYLGGNIAPHLRKAELSPKGRRLSAVLLGVEGLIALGVSIAYLSESLFFGAHLLALAPGILFCWAAVVMFRSGRASADSPLNDA